MKEIEAKVASLLDSTTIAINAGSDVGVEEGDQVILWKVVDVSDPDTKDKLGSVRLRTAVLNVTEAFPAFSVAQLPSIAFGINLFGGTTKRISGAGASDDSTIRINIGDEVTVVESPSRGKGS